MANKPKRHLIVRGGRAACGLPAPRLRTEEPAQVSCYACMKTVHMADAEIRAQLKLIK